MNFCKFLQYSLLVLSLREIPVSWARGSWMVEPLRPNDFEAAAALVISASLEGNLTLDDGTTDDIITPRRTLRDSGIKPWPKGVVPYMLGDGFSTEDRAMIARSVTWIHAVSCVRIVARTTEENYIVVEHDDGGLCSSVVGFKGGKQSLTLADRCVQRPGSTVHEFMHALGFYHEQSRIDRDEYVTVFFENMTNGAKGNYRKHEETPANSAAGYDTGSITHYGSTAFSKNGKATMLPKDGKGELGQRKELTKLDIEKINNFYNCGAQKDSQAVSNTTSTNTTKPDKEEKETPVARRILSLCIDFDPVNCKKWAKKKYCKKSAIFMSVFCKVSCNQCDMPCRDMNKSCPTWAQKQYCLLYMDYMHHYCQKSCGICVF